MLLLSTTTLGIAADKAIIILDASGSMWAQIDGKPKLEIARESLQDRAAVGAGRSTSSASWPMAIARRAVATTSS